MPSRRCVPFAFTDPKTGEVIRGIARVARERPRVCVECRKPCATQVCDRPPANPSLLEPTVGGRQPTCDRSICRQCATRLSDGRDFCRLPACQAAAQQGALELRARGVRSFAK